MEHDIGREAQSWKVLSETEYFADPHLQLSAQCVMTPSRRTSISWTVVHRKSAVVIAPVTGEGKFVLVQQERIPIRETTWEMPAGQVDELCDEGSMKNVALRELREEAGYELAPEGELTFLGDFFSSAGFTDERAFLFLAQPVHPAAGGATHQESEGIVGCREFSADELIEMIAKNEIRDANTLSVYARLVARRLLASTEPTS